MLGTFRTIPAGTSVVCSPFRADGEGWEWGSRVREDLSFQQMLASAAFLVVCEEGKRDRLCTAVVCVYVRVFKNHF